MQIDNKLHFDAAPAAVRAMLMDPGFWTQLAVGRVDHCNATPTSDGVTVDIGVRSPSQVQRLTGDVMSATLTATWASEGDGWGGPVAIDVHGMPAAFKGTSSLTPNGDGADVVYQGDLTIRIPVVGAALEKKTAPFLLGVLEAQQDVGTRWLAEHA
ncbi:MAG: DUF2505 domain-containing protein [Propionibacteriaceae bacterium]|nr:DUF2505 domain-containing protein [Propionibacteriaceae bacterium]